MKFFLFFLLALLLHGIAYVLLSRHAPKSSFSRRYSLIRVTWLKEIPQKPKIENAKPNLSKIFKPFISLPSPSPVRLNRKAAPFLSFHEAKIHPEKNQKSKGLENPNFRGMQETKEGFGKERSSVLGGIGKGGKNEGKSSGASSSFPQPKLLISNRKSPAVLVRCSPPYPETAREQEIQGTVQLSVLVGRKGEIERVQIAKSAGDSELDDAAAESVRNCWKFAPAIQNGDPVETWTTFSVDFQLR